MLTFRQKQILDFIENKVSKDDIAPSQTEIAKRFRLSSVATVHEHLSALEKKGYLLKLRGQARALVPVSPQLFASYTLVPNGIPVQNDVVYKETKNIENFHNKVIEGDCLEIMHQIPSRSIPMILCDLPYGTTQNSWDSVIPLGLLWKHYERIIRDDGVIVLTGQGLFTAQLMLSNPRLFKYKITWVKSKPTNFLNAKKQPLRKHEDVCIFYKSQPLYNPQMTPGEPYNKGFRKDQLTGSYGDFKTVEVKSDGQRYPTDVVYFKTAESEGEVYHPTQKPVELGRYLIRTFTKKSDVVLDNTCGSGSFLVAAVLEGRKFIGIERNQEAYLHKKHRTDYIQVCNERVKQAKREYESKSTLF